MLELRTLGALDLRDSSDGHELRSVTWQPKRLALLAYLTLAARRRLHRRDEILPIFWPETDEGRARRALSQALYTLRRGLGEGVIESCGDEEIRVDEAAIWCDAAAFEDALDGGEAVRALELYGGDLLPGFHVAGCPEFERWLDKERARLRDRAVQAAWSLAEERGTAGNGVQAAYWARRAAEWAQYDETLIRRLIRLLARLGDRPGALTEYEAFARRLASDLELEPSEETRSLVEEIRSAETGAGTASGASTSAAPRVESGTLDPARETAGKTVSRRRAVIAAAATVVPVTVLVGWLAMSSHWTRTPDPRLAASAALANPDSVTTSNHTAHQHVVRAGELLQTNRFSNDESVKRSSLDEAQRLAEKAIELDPNYADAYFYLATIYSRRARSPGGESWRDSAAALANSLLKLGPRGEGRAYEILGNLAWRDRRWAEGADYLAKAAELLPAQYELYSDAAMAHYLLGEFDKSYMFWKRAAAIDPERTDPCLNGSYFHLDLLDEAEACSRRLLEINYQGTWGFRVLLKTYLAQGRDLKAQQLLERTPPNVIQRSYYLLNQAGDVALVLGDHERAREYYERGLAKNKNSISSGVWVARTSMAYILWNAGARDSARVLLEQSEAYDWDRLEKQPMRWAWYYDLAAVHAIRGDKEAAHRYLREAFNAGWHWFRLGLRDPRLESLRADDRFRLLIAEVQDSLAAMRARIRPDRH